MYLNDVALDAFTCGRFDGPPVPKRAPRHRSLAPQFARCQDALNQQPSLLLYTSIMPPLSSDIALLAGVCIAARYEVQVSSLTRLADIGIHGNPVPPSHRGSCPTRRRAGLEQHRAPMAQDGTSSRHYMRPTLRPSDTVQNLTSGMGDSGVVDRDDDGDMV